jgi:hypothetical protein
MKEDQILGRIAVLEYMLAQSFALALNLSNDPNGILIDAADHFAKSFEKACLNDEQKRYAMECSDRLFATLRANLRDFEDKTH